MKRLAVLLGATIAVLLVLLLRDNGKVEGTLDVPPAGAKQEARASVEIELPATGAKPRVSLEDSSEGSPDLPEQAAPEQGAILRVHVVSSETGEPAPDIRVNAFRTLKRTESTTSSFATVITGDDGRARFPVPSDVDLRLFFHRPGEHFGGTSLEVPALHVGEERLVIFKLLTERSQFHGRVVTRANAVPIEGAEIRVDPGSVVIAAAELGTEGHLIGSKPRAAVTGPAGEFALPIDGWNHSNALITATGYGPLVVNVGQGHETLADEYVVELERAANLTGVIVGSTEALVVQLATDFFQLGERGPLGGGTGIMWKVRVGDDGTFKLPDLPARAPLKASVHGPDGPVLMISTPLQLTAGETREVLWKVGSGASIRGQVIDESGGQINELAIWLAPATEGPLSFLYRFESHETTRTDATGAFVFENVAVGNWRVGPEPSDSDNREVGRDAIAPAPIVVSIGAGMREVHVQLPIHRGLFIKGRVLAGDGRPRADRWVHAYQEGRALNDQSAEDGSFVIGPLTPGTYTVGVSGGGSDAPSTPLLAEAGEEYVEIRLPAGGSVSGTVVDRVTGEKSDGTVEVSVFDGGNSYTSRSTRTETFEFDGLTPGTYTIVATTDFGLIGIRNNLNVLAGTPLTDVVVELSKGARIRVGYSGSKAFAQVILKNQGGPVSTDTIAAGAEQVFVVPPGNISVELRAFDDWTNALPDPVTKEVNVAGGETVTVDFAE